MSKHNHTHLFIEKIETGTYDDGSARTVDRFACGDLLRQLLPEVVAWQGADLPDLLEGVGEAELAKLAEAGKVVTVEMDPKAAQKSYTDFKSWRIVKLNGEPIGFVGFPPGFGMNWQVFAITMNNDDDDFFALRDKYPAKRPETYVAIGFHSMEAAMLAVPALAEKGKLHTAAQVKIDRDRWNVARAERVQTLVKREARAKAELNDMLAGLRSITESDPGHVLTNFEREAVHNALKRLTAEQAEGAL